MPYVVRKSDSCPSSKPWGVFRKGTERKVGCHESEESAQAQQAALYAAERRGEMKAQQRELERLEEQMDELENFSHSETDVGETGQAGEPAPDGAIKDVSPEPAPSDDTEKAVWTAAAVNDLPDSAFLYVEPGEKEDGKTVPRSKRHFPYKDASGKIDLPHLRNAIARIPQSNAPGLTPEKKKALQNRARRTLASATKESEGLLSRIADVIKGWFASDEEPGISPFTIYKDKAGEYHWLVIYSNNYRDDDGIPEIISADAHKDFVAACDSGAWKMPELWYWHVPFTDIGKAQMVAYDDNTGFAIAAGKFYPTSLAVVEKLKARADLLVSHGMPGTEIRRDEADPTIITRYRSREFSLLPGTAAANRLTGSMIIQKETEMADFKDKLDELAAVGFDTDALVAKLEAAKKQAEEEQRDSKEVNTEVTEAPPTESTEPQAEPAAEPAPTPQPAPEPAKEADVLLKALGEMLKPISDRLDALEQVKATLEQAAQAQATAAAELAKEKANLQPAASMAALIRSSVIGKEEARVDGRDSLAKDKPKETAAPLENRSGLPYENFIDALLTGKDWRDTFGIKKS